MGWTSYMASHYYRNGKVNVKAEMDDAYTWENTDGKCVVLKSKMVGSIYYAAVKHTKKITNETSVVCAVCVTSTSCSDGMNFGYKGMSDSCHPFYYDCPKSILELLTPTDSESANEWRKRCWEKLELNKSRGTLASLPIGTIIKWTAYGKEHKAFKHSPGYQFKKPFWMSLDYDGYVKKNHITENWEVAGQM